MDKVKYLLIAASLIICIVMISLIFKGVHLKPKLMVKWSAVETLEIAGQEMAQFLYPIFKEQPHVVVLSQEKQSHFFFKGLLEQSEKDMSHVDIQMGEKKLTENAFVIQVIGLTKDDELNSCQDRESLECLKLKSLNLYKKKERDSNKFWISMYRTSTRKVIFFFVSNKIKI